VLVTDPIHEDGLRAMREFAEVEVSLKPTEEELCQKIKGFDALVVRSATKVTRRVIESAADLKVVARAGAGLDNIDVAAARERGIQVINAPEAPTVAVAELVFALMLAFARRIPQADAGMRAGRWEKKKLQGIELFGKTLGIVGTGRIGRAVAERARAFGMRLLFYDVVQDQEFAERVGGQYVDLKRLLAESDFVTVHVPLLPQTRHLLGENELALMKPTAVLVNTSRGAVVDERALARALRTGRLAGACIDVYEHEPPVGSPLLECPNTVLTPHIGASTVEAQRAAALIIAKKLREILSG
jgi:D-3-phosphoglycerate dehydrogenase